jgi:hypothetical protein
MNDHAIQPEMVEVIDDFMEVEDQVDVIPTWAIVQLGNNSLVEGASIPSELPMFENKSITLHHVNFDSRAKKLQIEIVR